MTDQTAQIPAARRVSSPITIAYATGAVAYGIKDSGFGTFLLLYYNQVIGVDPSTVGLVIMAALVLDAFIDPAVGALSDRTRSRWGRRHPWMYASALPIAIGWLLLWHPPQLSVGLTALWLFVTAVIVRSAVSCYEVPSQALTPELTADYDERTRITAWRYLLGWSGGLLMMLLAYRVFLSPRAGYPNGLLRGAGYGQMAIVGAALMMAAILISALGTHREIKRLPRPVVAPQSLRGHFRELAATMKNRAFAVLMLAGLCAYTNQGISYAMANYMYSYVWQMGSALTVIPFVLMAGVLLAFGAAPIIGRHTSKPKAAMIVTLAGTILQVSPYALRLAGAFPDPHAEAFLPIYFAFVIIGNALTVSGFILGASMMADVVEQSEVETGRRSEGVFFAGSFFIQKCTSGVGIFAAGAILGLANFPARAMPGAIPVATIDRLTLIYIAIYLTIGLLAATAFTQFPFGRAEHEARLARIAATAENEGAAHAP